MTHYSSPEVDNQAKNLASLLQAKLAGVGIKSEVASNWYSYVLMVEDPEIYRAVSIHESVDKGSLLICFETIRLGTDGEILYLGINIEENAGPFDEIVEEAKRQNDWAKRRVERQSEIQDKAQLSDTTLKQLREEFPAHARSILVHSQQDCTFSLTVPGLTPDRLRELLRSIEGAT